MSYPTPSKDAEDNVAYGLNASSRAVAEELDVSMAVAASLDYAQVLPSQVNDHANWLPKSSQDWEIYNRQNAAIGKAVAENHDPDLQTAIQSSIEEHEIEMRKKADSRQDRRLNGEDVSAEKGKSPTVRPLDETPGAPTLADRIHDLSFKVGLELPTVCDPHGDTYVYLDPSTQQPEQDEATYAHYTERYETPMLMKKQTLLSFNSSFFEDMFGPTYQFRILRRRGLVGNLPDHVKYAIDLTPPTEGDEAVYLMTELCCSEGVRKWFLANQRWQVSKSMIGGEDEFMPSFQGPKRFDAKITTSGARTDGVGYSPSPGFLNSQGALVPLPLEYSPVRHRSAIKRVLAALQGLDPQLDSAPKVWTTFAVAKYFSLTRSPLTDYIVRWLRASPNSYFLEVNPEISLKIADGLQCDDLCRDIFAILVGEEALATVYRCNDPEFGTQANVYGRKREDLLEPYQTRIEYASKAFVERIGAEFSFLVAPGMSWFESLPEFSKLVYNGPPSVDAAKRVQVIKSRLEVYVRGAIYKLLTSNYIGMSDADQALFGNNHLFPNTSWQTVWKTLRPNERVLTRSFWQALQICCLFWGPTNLDLRPSWGKFCPTVEDPEFEPPDKGLMEIVFMKEIEYKVKKLNYWSVKPGSGSCGGERMRPGLADEPTPRVSPDSVSEPLQVDIVFEHLFKNASTTNSLPTRQEPRSLSDPAQYNLSHDVRQPSVPTPSMADEADEKEYFVLHRFFAEARIYLRDFATRILEPPDFSMRTQCLELALTNTLVSLTDAEWKFLPLWAGGNDDGSGGVFNDDVPLSFEGFSTAGPKIRTSSGSSSGSSEFTFGVISLDTCTNTSLQNNDGRSEKRKVVSANEGSLNSEDDMSVIDGLNLSSNNSIVLVPSINGSSITFGSEHTISTPPKLENDEGKEEEQASRLVADVEVGESDNAPGKEKGKLPDTDEFEDTFELNDTLEFSDDDDSDTMIGDYGDEESEI
ncbi:hypothetical protein MMC29_003358 [Sticta canariensis]|nr:hypothetical protein [Sticta canariensis]